MEYKTKKILKDSIIGIILFFGIVGSFVWFKYAHDETQSFKNAVLISDKFTPSSWGVPDGYYRNLEWVSNTSLFYPDVFVVKRIDILKNRQFVCYVKLLTSYGLPVQNISLSPDKKQILLDCSGFLKYVSNDNYHIVRTWKDVSPSWMFDPHISKTELSKMWKSEYDKESKLYIHCNGGTKWWASDSSGVYELTYCNSAYIRQYIFKGLDKVPAYMVTPVVYYFPVNGKPRLIYKGEPFINNKSFALIGVTNRGEPVISCKASSNADTDQSTTIIKYNNTGVKVLEKHIIPATARMRDYNIIIQRVSPQGNMIATVTDRYIMPSLFEQLQNNKYITKRKYELCITDLDGHVVKNLGGIYYKSDMKNDFVNPNNRINIEWLPDGKHISVLCGTKLYLVPV